MAFMPGNIWTQLLIWMAIGGTIYFTYGRTRSKLRLASVKK
jgi:hypothetical protein